MSGSRCGIVDPVRRALSEEHPLAALALGVVITGISWLWLRYAEASTGWLMRALGPRYSRMPERRWYRVVHVYFVAALLLFAGLGTIVASAINLAR